MTQLTDQERQQITNGIMRLASSVWDELPNMTKANLRAAVNATDTWIDNQGANFNAALPQPAKNEMTLAQKTLMFCAVAAMRVSPAFARSLLGEVE